MFDMKAPAEDNAEKIVRDSSTYWQDVWKRFRRDPLAMFGVCVILVMAVACILVPMFSKYDYSTMDLTNMNAGPSWAHLCGTDQMGRDLFIRILYGARISLSIGLVAAAINFVIGVVYGGIAGYVGGKVDMVMMRIVDILISLPSMLYNVLIMLVLGSSVGSVLVALCFTSWTGTARVVRSEVMRLKHSEYVLAARLSGARFWNLLTTHLVPNAMGPIIVSTAFLIPSAIFSEAFLSFLGIGIQAPMASWGTLANDARSTLLTFPHQMIFPVLAICITMFSFNFIGDGLRDALDPKLKK
ncbi:MAG: ABC transporter permease [Clostridia bacterium]|nr:ABC transporter permease [Clostridia bacterium]